MARAAEVPADLPPPVVPATAVAPTAEPELDPRELKALSRQERKAAKAALRREQQEARNAARQAKAMAKVAAKAAERVEPAAAAEVSGRTAGDDVVETVPGKVEPTASDTPEVGAGEHEPPESGESATSSEPTDPRARAAQRVQRRLGKDAEKLSAAEARARAREEARRRRAQAKEQRSGVVAEEVVRPPDEAAEGNLDEDVSVVEPLTDAEPLVAWPVVEPASAAEPRVDELIAEPPAIEEPATEEAVAETEAELPKPVVEERIDEPAPVEDEVPTVAESRPIVTTREIRKPPPVEDTEEPKSRSQVGLIAGIVGLIALGISVLLAVGALLVALGFDSGGLYEVLRTVANTLVGPLDNAFDFSGANAERKEHFLAWGAGSIGYLLISFVGQAVQRSNDEG